MLRRSKAEAEIPTASMADIAFLLIIFFLVSTTMNMDKGLGLTLPAAGEAKEVPRKNIAHYASSKGGLAMLTKVMALELAEYKISVVAIAPGVVATSMNEELLRSPQKMREMISRIPLRRIAKPEDIARVVVYVASEEANYITGTTIYVDGGFSLIGHDKP